MHDVLHALVSLYANSDVVALLNSTSPAFFVLVQEMLVDNLILSVARMTDKPESGHPPQANLTLSRLVLELSDQKHSRLRARLATKCQRIEKLSRPIRSYRHKVLAHADRAERLRSNTRLGKNITISLVRRILEKMADFLNTFDYAFTKGETAYQPIGLFGDVSDFVSFLQKTDEGGTDRNVGRGLS